MNQFAPLLAPLTINQLTLRNRLVMAPMTRSKSPNHIPGTDVAAYYRRRAEGGVGLIITEGTTIEHPAAHGFPDVPNFWGKEPLTAWGQIVGGVHDAGAKFFPQLWHVGSVRQRQRHDNPGVDNPRCETACRHPEVPGFAPSPIPHPYIANGEVPHEMNLQEIRQVIDAYARSARNAVELGCDGVELHGAHGYLIDQFLWERTNQRTDQYGGPSLRERRRFAVETVAAVRDAVGSHFPICFRFSQWKLGDYEAKLAQTPEELAILVRPLSEAGVDLFHCSTRRFWEPEFQGSDLNLAGWTQQLTGKPAITVGSIGLDLDFVTQLSEAKRCHASRNTLDELLQRLGRGEFALAAVGRALLADPQWLSKVLQGEFGEIRPFSKQLLTELY
jgi:2,4-dienoyl-CoA reductase-like NADH-dependent reductase (Old Yellow Enzyme family)